jgi:hypothetical protein
MISKIFGQKRRKDVLSRDLTRNGWTLKRQTASHCILAKAGWPDVFFAFHDSVDLPNRKKWRTGPDSRLRDATSIEKSLGVETK